MRFYIISPHSHCDKSNPERHCDRVAKFYAETISEYLKNAGHDVILQLSDRLRFGDCDNPDEHGMFRCDYNRNTTLKSEWRQHFEAEIEKMKPDFIFEVHSYPGEMSEYFYLWQKFKLQCIKSQFNSPFIAKLVDEIGDVPMGTGIASPDFEPSIMEQVGSRFKHTLFEFNEMHKDKELAKRVADAVVRICSTKNDHLFFGGTPFPLSCKYIVYILIAIIILLLFVLGYIIWKKNDYYHL